MRSIIYKAESKPFVGVRFNGNWRLSGTGLGAFLTKLWNYYYVVMFKNFWWNITLFALYALEWRTIERFETTTNYKIKTCNIIYKYNYYNLLAMSTSEPVLIWAQRFGTWSKFRSLSGQPERLVSNSARSSDSQPQNRAQYSALSYNPRTDTMYWVDKSNLGFIMFQSRLQTFAWSAATPNKMNTFSNITKFTVDWATNNIYFIDSRDVRNLKFLFKNYIKIISCNSML